MNYNGTIIYISKAKINLFVLFSSQMLKCEVQNMDGSIAAVKNVDGRYREIKRERVERNRQTQRNFPILISSGVILKGKPTTKHRKSEASFSMRVVGLTIFALWMTQDILSLTITI